MDARLNITYDGQNGDLPDLVDFGASDLDVRRWVTEALRTGGIPGIARQPRADVNGFLVDRYAATAIRPYAFIAIRPKTPFG